jgi:arylsulfatase A-like enzyme
MNRRDFLWLIGLIAAGANLWGGCGKDEPGSYMSRTTPKPLKNQVKIDHIILISMDTARADHLACYGHPFIQTPNIDALAKEGILFEQHINAASTTLASHTSLMTGTYPHSHGIARNGDIISKNNIMLAETLKSKGFVTAGFIGAFPLDSHFGFDQGFIEYDTNYEFVVQEKLKKKSQRRAKSITDAALRWLDKNMAGSTDRNGKGKNFFLFLHYFDPHLPYDAPSPFKGMYRKPDSAFDHSMEAVWSSRPLLRQRGSPETHKIARAYDAEYSAEITYCDHHFGRFIEGLKTRGLFDSSLIILTSDHGETITEHFNILNHGTSVYDTEILTPLIIRFPGGKFGSQRISRLVSNIDIVPTINHLLGLENNDRVEGQSFAGLIDGPLGPRDPVFAEATQPHRNSKFDSDPLWPNRGKFQCIRTARYKYMLRTTDKQFGFYDLQNDPMEQNNLLKDPKGFDADLVASLRKQLENWSADVHPVASSKPTESEEAIRLLKSLGYLGDNN